MERLYGTRSMGLRAPIIKEGDDVAKIAVDTVIEANKRGIFEINDKDVLGITEAVVARSQGNYATTEQIAADVKAKFPDGEAGIIFPILSRNRFAICLRGMAKGLKKVTLMLSYPGDEVGNHIIDYDALDEKGVDPYKDVLTEDEFVAKFGRPQHTFTGVDYVSYYKELINEEGAECQIIFANDPRAILKYTDSVLNCDIHTRERTKRLLKNAGAKTIFGMDDILNESINKSGFNKLYGLLGSNKATEDTVKLFPNDCTAFVMDIQAQIQKLTGKRIEVLVYGDGAFKDPVGKIWELADPVVSPGYTEGLNGTPNEVKLKYLADNDFSHLEGEELKEAISNYIKKKDNDLKGNMASEGTTPRRLTDLIGSLCDLTSGSGDKGTPFIYIQGYFDNFTSETK